MPCSPPSNLPARLQKWIIKLVVCFCRRETLISIAIVATIAKMLHKNSMQFLCDIDCAYKQKDLEKRKWLVLKIEIKISFFILFVVHHQLSNFDKLLYL